MRFSKPIGISATFLVTVCAIAGFTILLVGGLWLSGEYARFSRESKALRQDYIKEQEATIRNEVERVLDDIQYRNSKMEENLRASLKMRVYEAHAIASHLIGAEGGKCPG